MGLPSRETKTKQNSVLQRKGMNWEELRQLHVGNGCTQHSWHTGTQTGFGLALHSDSKQL